MDESGRSSPVTLADTRQVFDRADEPWTPRSTAEIADELDCEPGEARRTLEALVEDDALAHKQVAADTDVWWSPPDGDPGSQATPERRHDRLWDEESDVAGQFRMLVESVEEYAIFMMDPDGYIQSWNPGAEQVKGYSADEIVGEHFSRFYTDDAAEADVPAGNLQAAQEDGHLEDEGWRVRKNGERFWANVTISAILDEGELRGFAKVTRDMTDRHEYEQQLREEKERFQRMIEEVKDYAIFMLDSEGHIQTWNQGAKRIKGYDEATVLGEHFSLFYPDDGDGSDPGELLAQAAAQGRVSDEGWRLRADGSRFWASVVITALFDEEGTLQGFAKVTRDLTDRKRREDRLAALDELGRDLLAADTPQSVSELVIDAAMAGLDLPLATIALYDDDSGTLQPVAQTARAAELSSTVPIFDPESAIPWDVFGDDEPLVVDDLSGQSRESPADHPVGSAVLVPVGRHGLFIAGFETTGGPGDEAVDFVKIVAATLEAALNNAERQQLLSEREATLEAQNESLTRVNRINDVIRTIDQALIDASTREEIEQAVCAELATAGPYRVAWIARPDAGTDTLNPTAWAGIGADYVDGLSVTTGERPTEAHPAGVAARERAPTTIQDVRSDPPFEPWRKEALKRGFRSMSSVPIMYEDSLYGVLTVQADQSNTFTGTEGTVVAELGETIAHAINAVESKQALVSDEIIELKFHVSDPDISLLQLVDQTECAFELDAALSREGSLRIFFTTRGASPADIEAFVDDSLVFADLRLVADGTEGDGEGCRFEATVSAESLVATLVDHGGVPLSITAEGGEGEVVVALSTGVDVREFIAMFQTKYPGTELTARRTRDRTGRTPYEFRAAVEGELTDRQREVLHTAYFSGFFDTPRKSTGEEIGDALGVSQPTVTHHLRAAQRTLLGLLYDENATPPAALDR